ncbi:ATP-grasp domain-containing protein [Streptomyces sp. AN091965]|uniref:ATP-grasp domain-containing protein n=1 Tax=Streptomyces sp. AN091965 TaxID=2927803 RepID=UPI001F60FE6C|nr:ATP-grasp domain-containing protein [Streptomyces sp. AN091965]MCI3934988.1 ATP-grasp domain-containing protein [Streptomyces sp. AN091965]
MSQRVGAIVDAHSTGRYLPAAFREFGVACVHVQSTPEIPEFFRRDFEPSSFQEHHAHTGAVAETAAWLAARNVEFVIAGTENGVELADALSERLGLATNGTAQSRDRRDKGRMAEALRRAGLRAAVDHRASDPSEAVAWAVAQDQWPVVVKPVDSAGTENVHFCHDSAAVRSAAEKILGTVNRVGSVNRQLLVQQYLKGEQYYVNTVSADGGHYVAEIWSDETKEIEGAAVVSDREDLLPRSGERQEAIVAYVRDVLDALGLKWGPAHTEIMVTAAGPVLIETAARPVGSILPEAVTAATGDNHATLTAECYAAPEEFARRIPLPYALRKQVSMISLIADRSGYVESADGLSLLDRLPSYWGILSKISEGADVRRTVDILSSPGHVYLLHDSQQQIMRDYLQLRSWESSGLLYRVAPRPGC